MKRAIIAFIVTIIVGYLGACLTPFFGISFTIATMGSFIVYSIEKKQ